VIVANQFIDQYSNHNPQEIFEGLPMSDEHLGQSKKF
jgi:hypothetical protein